MRKYITLVLLVFGLCSVSHAGEWHIDSTLFCQNCHLQHASDQGQQVPGGPYSRLLLKETINELCLSCHDGSDPTAPDVLTPVPMYQGAPSEESAGGFFSLPGAANPSGHDLGVSNPIPLQTQNQFLALNCTHCHAAHGNGNYRNLSYDPVATGDSITLVDGVELFTSVSPDKPPTSTGSIAAYNRANTGYKQGYSDWCSSCHDQLATNVEALPPAHFNAHPTNSTLDAFAGDAHTDVLHWTTGLGEGFSTLERVPFKAPSATDFVSSRQASGSNEVFCLSCHRAHGGVNQKGILWPYIEGGQGFISGCQQCHNK